MIQTGKIEVPIDLEESLEAFSVLAAAMANPSGLPIHIRSKIEAFTTGAEKPFQTVADGAGFAVEASPALRALVASIRAGGL